MIAGTKKASSTGNTTLGMISSAGRKLGEHHDEGGEDAHCTDRSDRPVGVHLLSSRHIRPMQTVAALATIGPDHTSEGCLHRFGVLPMVMEPFLDTSPPVTGA